jgi:NCS1 family nucleobase:cation symporter-1
MVSSVSYPNPKFVISTDIEYQVYSGASFMSNILRCIFGHAFTNIPNHIPESVGITTQGMLAFFLFWLVHFPFCAFRPYQLRAFFWFKSIIILPAVWGLFIFCIANTHGNIGSLYSNTITGNKGWFIMYAINSGMGNTATLITNQPDIARWSKTKSGAQWSQLITNPIAVTLSASLGILATSAINNSSVLFWTGTGRPARDLPFSSQHLPGWFLSWEPTSPRT